MMPAARRRRRRTSAPPRNRAELEAVLEKALIPVGFAPVVSGNPDEPVLSTLVDGRWFDLFLREEPAR